MAAISPANMNCSKDEPRVLAATEALRTGLFQPVPCVDPDISNRVRITPGAPTVWGRLFAKKN